MASSHFGFAKLVSQNGTEFYIKYPTIILGRHTAQTKKCSFFCPLNQSKSISRSHAKIYFNFNSLTFDILCVCKNYIFVDKQIVSTSDGPMPLKNGSTIVIGDFPLLFLLPSNFSQQKNMFRDSSAVTIAFDYDVSVAQKQNPSKLSKYANSKPKEKLITIIKMLICESPSNKMTLENIVKSVENKYKNKYPEWVSKTPLKNMVRTILNNKRQFFSFSDRYLDSKKRPIFVETFTVKKLASKIVPDQFNRKSTVSTVGHPSISPAMLNHAKETLLNKSVYGRPNVQTFARPPNRSFYIPATSTANQYQRVKRPAPPFFINPAAARPKPVDAAPGFHFNYSNASPGPTKAFRRTEEIPDFVRMRNEMMLRRIGQPPSAEWRRKGPEMAAPPFLNRPAPASIASFLQRRKSGLNGDSNA